ncbi:hypothetical protein JOC34_000820 [Virgibacillus halotolerans]|uniref:hypothetical protein n=1 Tax=Virgibacillus halotolerans TaxID=1071053 RepID=UPI0019621FBB|nr:hypothetical protein [Virgibacillus halotolerans]MBM7598463.1 hypothetical protein [Virgibacillus halotolerans]
MEKSYFYDSTENDERIYQAADFARFHAQIIGDGVSNTASLPDLEVTAKTNMDVSLGAGYMFANGYMYENSSTITMKHDIADNNNDRIDRIVIRFNSDPAERSIKAVIKKGTPASNPAPPAITRDSYVHEMSVAQVRIVAGKSYIEQSAITDERADDNVCGYIPLHNIYRGLGINELGMVTMPNQSFIKTMNSTPQTITKNTSMGNAVHLEFGTIEEDKQNEITSGTQFTAKADGVYNYWVELAFEHNMIPVGAELHVYNYVNGKESFPLGTKLFSDGMDNFIAVNGFDSLKKGDKVDFRITSYQMNVDVDTRFSRIRVAKLA